ncbi:MAG: hypothetical protein R6U25_02590 [Alkalispirochaeta sp.]
MTVFLLLATPLAAITAYTFIAPRFGGGTVALSDARTRRQVLQKPIVVGALSFIPLYAIHSFVGPDLFRYSPGGLFFRSFLFDYFGWFAVQSVVSFLLVRRVRNRPEQDQYVIHLVVATVMLSFLSVADVITAAPAMTVEELFLRPLARIALLALMPVALTVADNARGGGWAVLVMILQPIPAAAMSMLYRWIRPGAAMVVLLALLIATGGVLWAMLWRESEHDPR